MAQIHLRTRTTYHKNSAWGQINNYLSLLDGCNIGNTDVHLYAGTPDCVPASRDKDCKHALLTYSHFADPKITHPRFADICNSMDVVFTAGDEHGKHMRMAAVTADIFPIALGHDHDKWFCPVLDVPNRNVLLFDRGRDWEDAFNVVNRYFDNAVQLSSLDDDSYTEDELRKHFQVADVFFKWGNEGWCYPMLQAMSAGCLVITDCKLVPYLVPGTNCLMFDNVAELWASLERAKMEPLTQIKKAGQEMAASLPWHVTIDRIKAHLKRVAS